VSLLLFDVIPARVELEQKTGQRIVTGQNYLPPAKPKRLKGRGNA